jgi:DNA-binding MurR/RpiR family transcriptional regulator
MRHLVRTFFDGSTEDAVAALLQNDTGMSDDELERLSQMIASAKREGR